MTEVGGEGDIQDMQRDVDSYARCCTDALLRGDMDAAHWHAEHYARLKAEVRALCAAASDMAEADTGGMTKGRPRWATQRMTQ